MPSLKIIVLSVLCFIFVSTVLGQYTDTVIALHPNVNSKKPVINYKNERNSSKIPVRALVIPGLMIAYGFTALENDGLKNLNAELKDEVYGENPHKRVSIDNYLQFAPAATVYGLNALGIKGKYNFRDRSMIYVLSNIILTGTVFSLKKITAVQRPDGSAFTSFPSGHTAEAFASAEFMRMEYKDVSPWYGIAGYTMAAATGYLRTYNNKHWFSDVVAGAGIGIASVKVAYWLYPKIQHKLFKDKVTKTVIVPTYQNRTFAVGVVHIF